MTLAAGWTAELGPPQQWRAVRRICSYAGVIPKSKQTGGPEDLRHSAQELEARGAHTQFAMAKRLVRLAKHWVTTGTIYRPKALWDPDTPKAVLATYYQALWDKLLLKWNWY